MSRGMSRSGTQTRYAGAIKTERCILNRLVSNDRDQVCRLRTDPEVRRYLGGPTEEAKFESQFLHMLGPCLDHYWAVRGAVDQAFIGLVSLDLSQIEIDTEVSYEFLPEYWGKGFATESVGAVVDFALADPSINRVVAETQAANWPSRRLLDRVGLHLIESIDRFGEEQVIYATKPGQLSDNST